MEAHEIAEQIHGEEQEEARHDWFRRVTGIYVGVVAMLLAIASLGGSDATKEMLNANIHASDFYAFYQAKYIRQVEHQIAAEQLELLGATGQPAAPEARARLDQAIKSHRDTAVRYESDPNTGDGKKELMARARHWDEERDRAAAQLPNFEYAEALFQIAIVLGSVAIVAASPWLLGVSGILATLGIVLTLNGYLLLVPLPNSEIKATHEVSAQIVTQPAAPAGH